MHETKEEAHKAWQNFKITRAEELLNRQSNPDVKDSLQKFIDRLKYDVRLNKETKFN